jgi:lipopolysaccharide transport system ATP-binding protein
MSDIAIRVEHLSKRYRLGEREPYKSLRDVIARAAAAPARWLHRNGQPAVDQGSGYFWALDDVSFEIHQGEAVGIIGRNGAGKSTLLKILSRITRPTKGEAQIYGRVGSLLEVGTGFHPELTGRENIFLNGAILGMKRKEIERKFDEIVNFAEIEKFLDTPVKRYSSGMYVRLAFAVAAHLEPEILLVDEVLAVGDAQFQKKCLGKMGEVAKEGRTVLFVSHNMAAVKQLCKNGILFRQGQIENKGKIEFIVESYLKSGSNLFPERLWKNIETAPGDDKVRLLGGRVIQQEQVCSIVDINLPTKIQFDFKVLDKVKDLVSGINIYNIEGICLFANCDWRPNLLEPGVYQKEVIIPPQTLSEGITSILMQLVFFAPNIPSVVFPDALRFEAVDSNHPNSVRGPYKEGWPGLLRLKLDWTKAICIYNDRGK